MALKSYYIERVLIMGRTSLLHGQQVSCYDYAKVLPRYPNIFIFTPSTITVTEIIEKPRQVQCCRNRRRYHLVYRKGNQGKGVYIRPLFGALLAAYVSAKAPDYIIATVLEDGPFFSTLPGGRKNHFMAGF